ncbi:MAG: ChaN family lipoprotein [Sphingobacteriaceae bacterium]|nr:ChaN family lipoprotein [Sphingobacteriaceae bacterium]
MKNYIICLISILIVLNSRAQLTEKNYVIFNNQEKTKTVDDVIKETAQMDVVFFGEEHNDSVAHYMELTLLKKMHELHKEKLVLSLEMFERDCQVVLNEYLQGKIKESHFKKDARAWSNYKDYRPLIEYAKANGIRVVAANTSMRYVSMANKGTQAALLTLSPEAKKWIAPLPIDTAKGAYYEKLKDIMGYNSHEPGMSAMMPKSLNGQSVWDATMAHSIAEVLNEKKGYKVLHLVGRFHVDEKFGICEQILNYKKDVKFTVLTEQTDENFPNIKLGENKKLGDYIIFSDPKVPKSYPDK